MNRSWYRRTGLMLVGTLLVVTAACTSSNNKANSNSAPAPASNTAATASVASTAISAGTAASIAGTTVSARGTTVSVTTTANKTATAAGVRSTAVIATAAGTSIAGALKIGTGTAAAAAASGAPLTDCEYAAKFQSALLWFLGSFLGLAGDALGSALSGSPTPSAAAANAQAVQAYDTLNAAVGQVITNLQGLNLPADLKQVNDQIITAFQSLATPLAQATAAAKAGDLAKAQSILDTLNTDFPSALDQLDKDFPEVTARLSKCA